MVPIMTLRQFYRQNGKVSPVSALSYRAVSHRTVRLAIEQCGLAIEQCGLAMDQCGLAMDQCGLAMNQGLVRVSHEPGTSAG